MNNLALVSLGLFFIFGLIRNSKNNGLAHATVLAVGSGIYLSQTSTGDFLHMFCLTQIAFGAFRILTVRPRRRATHFAWLTALGVLVGQLLFFKMPIANGTPMPVGLAYLTLQLIGVFVWGYFQKSTPKISWLQFNFSALFFPTIVAGPILRTERIAAQLDAPASLTRERLQSAFLLICIGLFKKAVADQLGLYTDASQIALRPQGWDAALLTLAFYSQCYADFSGYSDIARGLARAYGIEIPLNFNVPFLAANITDHWKRWHISLNEWFRDYVFTWLFASNFLTLKRRMPRLTVQAYLALSIVLTCLFIGIWHGIEARFLLWAFINALCILLHQSLFQRLPFSNRSFQVASVLFTFFLTCFLNLLFLETSVAEIWRLIGASLRPDVSRSANVHQLATLFYSFFLVFLSIVTPHVIDRRLLQSDYRLSNFSFISLTLAALVYCFASGAIHQAFLYSRF